MRLLFTAILLSFLFVFSASATTVVTPATTLVVERFVTASVNATISSHVYKVRLHDEAACTTVRNTMNAAATTQFDMGGRPVQSYVIASCAPVYYDGQLQ